MSGGDIVFNVFLYSFLVLFVIVTLYPVYNIFVYSFSEKFAAVIGHIRLLPRRPTLDNYAKILIPSIHRWKNFHEIDFQYEGFIRGYINTVLRTLLGTFMGLFANALLSYILSRKRFLFRTFFSVFWIITMYVQGGIVPTYILYSKLHLTKSFLVYIIPGLINAMYVLVMRTYMKNIPDSLEEAARIDGAGDWRIFTTVISPLCKPVYAAVALFIAVGHWNSWFDAMLYNRLDSHLTTVQFELMKKYTELPSKGCVVSSASATPVTIKAASAVLTMLPLLVIYPFFQRYFIFGLKVGGVKD